MGCLSPLLSGERESVQTNTPLTHRAELQMSSHYLVDMASPSTITLRKTYPRTQYVQKDWKQKSGRLPDTLQCRGRGTGRRISPCIYNTYSLYPINGSETVTSTGHVPDTTLPLSSYKQSLQGTFVKSACVMCQSH